MNIISFLVLSTNLSGWVTSLLIYLWSSRADRLSNSSQIWDLRTGQISDTIKYDYPITALQFDNRKIVSAAGENGVKVSSTSLVSLPLKLIRSLSLSIGLQPNYSRTQHSLDQRSHCPCRTITIHGQVSRNWFSRLYGQTLGLTLSECCILFPNQKIMNASNAQIISSSSNSFPLAPFDILVSRRIVPSSLSSSERVKGLMRARFPIFSWLSKDTRLWLSAPRRKGDSCFMCSDPQKGDEEWWARKDRTT